MVVDTQEMVGHVCYVRSAWTTQAQPGEWVEAPDLECLQFSDVAAPGHGSATFVWRYGSQMRQAVGTRPADSDYVDLPRSGLMGWYVKVQTSTGIGWMGVIVDTADQRGGSSGGVAEGVETLTAFALSFLLDQQPIRSSKVDAKLINDVIPFNGGAVTGSASRTADNRSGTETEFTAENPFPWDAYRAIDYLLQEHAPKNAAGDAVVPFQVEEVASLGYKLPLIEYAGLTVWQAIALIVDRRRGLGFRIRVQWDEDLENDVVALQAFTTHKTAIDLPDGSQLPANPVQTPLDLDGALNVLNLRLTDSALHRADRVIVRGERRGSVCTLNSSKLDPDWTEEQLDEYNAARSADTGYDGLEDEEKARENAIFRASDRLRNVMCQWRLPDDWDFGSITGGWVFPAVDPVVDLDLEQPDSENPDPDQSTLADVWIPALRIQPFLPMVPWVDYSGGIIQTDAQDEDDFIPALVWFGTELAERMDAEADVVEDGRRWSVQTRAMQTAPGLRFEVVGGQQHFIAADLYVANGSYEALQDEQHVVQSTSWSATVYMQQPEFVMRQRPVEPSSGDVERQVEIRVPGAYLDWLMPGTRVAVSHDDDGTTSFVNAEGGWLRDDRERLDNIAALAWEYYRQSQKLLQLTYRAIDGTLAVGTLITQLQEDGGTEDVNTVVTSWQVQLRNNITTIRTAFSELDFAGVVQ